MGSLKEPEEVTGKVTNFASIVKQGIEAATDDLTTDLRKYISSTGWDILLARNVEVTHSGEKFKIKVNSDDVLEKEYGTSETEPSGAVRSWSTGPRPEAVLIRTVTANLGDLL
jgi:hypothetical protein